MARSTTIDYKTGVRFVDNGCSHHMTGERKGFKDLDETKMRRIWLGDNKEIQVEGEGTIAVQTSQDSDWAGNVNDKKSISGNIFTLGSAAITWSSKKQSTTSLSSSDAEYVAATSSTCQVLWLRKLLADLHQEEKGETKILCDNLLLIAMAKYLVCHGRSKHIDIRHHFICDLVTEGLIELKSCSREEQGEC
ncbi:hypothetical protein KY289_000806 [Solanum tuberosum]|nr:hypothetical protein KY289_000806 [Solanum tuberosum]